MIDSNVQARRGSVQILIKIVSYDLLHIKKHEKRLFYNNKNWGQCTIFLGKLGQGDVKNADSYGENWVKQGSQSVVDYYAQKRPKWSKDLSYD